MIKNSLIENQEKIIETIQKAGENGTKSEHLEQDAKDTIIKEQQLIVCALKRELVNAQGLTEDVKKKFDKKLEVFMKESDRTILQKEEKLAATLIELDKSDTFLRNCREEVDNLKRNYEEANNHEINEIKHQLGLGEQASDNGS